jgi:hypothetical protein
MPASSRPMSDPLAAVDARLPPPFRSVNRPPSKSVVGGALHHVGHSDEVSHSGTIEVALSANAELDDIQMRASRNPAAATARPPARPGV